MRNTNAARTKSTDPDPRDSLVEEVVEAFGSLRGRGMRGIQNVHRNALSVGHLQVLVRLQLGGPAPVSRLAEWLGVSAAGATGMVGRMQERGLVERGRDERDRRVVLVRLTTKGRSVLDEIGSRGRASLRRVLARLDLEELARLRDGLAAFQRAARELAQEEEACGDAGPDRSADGPENDPGGRGARPGGAGERGTHGAAADPE